jgi:amino acid transporter
MPENVELTADEQLLAKLGYKQDLNRSWSGFSNFAISFSIISILAGCLTNFGAGLNNGGPVSISWTWPILSVFILIIGLTMSELVSAYPTSGGIYWWASKLGGPMAGFYTGWLNLIGLIAVTAGVSYGAATFVDLTLDTYSKSWNANYSLTRVFIIFLVVLAMASILNISRWSWSSCRATTRALPTSSPTASTTPATSTAARRASASGSRSSRSASC